MMPTGYDRDRYVSDIETAYVQALQEQARHGPMYIDSTDRHTPGEVVQFFGHRLCIVREVSYEELCSIAQQRGHMTPTSGCFHYEVTTD